MIDVRQNSEIWLRNSYYHDYPFVDQEDLLGFVWRRFGEFETDDDMIAAYLLQGD